MNAVAEANQKRGDDMLNARDVRKCKNSLELNQFIEKYIAERNSSNESFGSIYWSLFEEWKNSLKSRPARLR
jgi:hypothetical protein